MHLGHRLIVCFGSIADVRSLRLGTNMAFVFVDGLVPWPMHFFPKTCGPLLQLIFRPIAHRRKAAARAPMIAQP